MRVERKGQLGDVDMLPEMAAAGTSAVTDSSMFGANFWTSVGTGVATGLVVWVAQRLLNRMFPSGRHS